MAGRLSLKECQPIFDQIAQGKSLRSACTPDKTKKSPAVPTMGRVLYAIQCDPTIFEQYARAIASRAHVLAEEVIEISDTEPDAQTARNRIDARKWYAGKVNRALYGEKAELTVKTELTDEQLDASIDDHLKRLGLKK